MDLAGANVVITGAGSGIGAAMARAFAAEGTARLWLGDVGTDGIDALTAELGDVARAICCDVSDEAAVIDLVAQASAGAPIDLFCANAGIATGQGLDAPDAAWDRIWAVNVMAHVYAARACLPGWRERGHGHLLITASAAGLLTNLGDAPYSATKHAAVGLAEWVAITHGDEGVTVSCLCPQGVRTPMVMAGLEGDQMAAQVVELMGLIEPDAVAAAVVDGLRDERFLILPHPEVARYQQNKASDPDRWLAGMRKLQRQLPGH
jgi:NAD(P)-dependent dehydrogenase (short-subunit alcohol dehydrogenase family)